ncbi:MAG: DsbA family oxidoreductase [Pseudomonadales bacterium]|nr:DsbA family oxidoreductase [Pseudomonadales bacterium]
MPLTIEVFSDLVCPWCFIGKRRLDRVLASPAGEGVEVRWRAYQLAPRIPAEGVDRARYYEAKFGNDGSRVPSRIAEEAASEGISMNFAAIRVMPNTFSGHRLLHLAVESGDAALQHLLADELFQAYFQQGLDVGRPEVLADVAARVGMDRRTVIDYLAGDGGVDAVRAELERAVDLGISGVPCFLLGGTFPIPGAQSAEVMTTFINRARERLADAG